MAKVTVGGQEYEMPEGATQKQIEDFVKSMSANIPDTVAIKDTKYVMPVGATEEQKQKFIKKNTPTYFGELGAAFADPVKNYIGNVKSAVNTPLAPKFFPNLPDRDPTAAEAITGVGSRTLGLAAGLPITLGEMLIGGANKAFGGVPGNIAMGVATPVMQAGDWAIRKNPLTPAFEGWGRGLAKTQFGKDMYAFSQNPTVRENLGGTLKAASVFAPEAQALRESSKLTKVAEKIGEKFPSLKKFTDKATTQTVIKSKTHENIDQLINRLPQAYKEKLPVNMADQNAAVGSILDKYDLRKFLDKDKPDANNLESAARKLYSSAVEKADAQLARDLGGSVEDIGKDAAGFSTTRIKMPEKINPVDLYRKAMDDEIAKDQTGMFRGLSGDMRMIKAQKMEKILSAYDHDMDFEELLKFKREVLNPKSAPIYGKSVNLNDNEKLDILLKKATSNKLINELKEASPESWALNQEANHLASIAEGAHGMKMKAPEVKVQAKSSGIVPAILGGVTGAALTPEGALQGAAAGSIMSAIAGKSARSLKNVAGGVAEKVPDYRLSNLMGGWGKPYSERFAAPNIRNLTEPIPMVKVTGKKGDMDISQYGLTEKEMPGYVYKPAKKQKKGAK